MSSLQLATLTTPLEVSPSDEFELVGSRLIVRRNGVVIHSIQLSAISVSVNQPVLLSGGGSVQQIYWSPPVANQIKVITKLERLPDNKYWVEWDNADGQEFNDWESLVNWANAVVTDPEFAKRLSLASVVAHSPDGTGLASLVGVKVTVAPNAYGNEATVEVPPQ